MRAWALECSTGLKTVAPVFLPESSLLNPQLLCLLLHVIVIVGSLAQYHGAGGIKSEALTQCLALLKYFINISYYSYDTEKGLSCLATWSLPALEI